jgi:LDH2 family malate/lactate/ureidoglycolate dehydrogenase
VTTKQSVRVAVEDLSRFSTALLRAAGADEPSADAVTRAVVEASLRGVDTHGIILLPHYVRAVAGGRINGKPRMRFEERGPAAGYLDADDGFGHPAAYAAIEHGIALARRSGVGAVAVGHSSHFGAAGCYSVAAARQGFLGFAFGHSDSVVLPHDGVKAFNGTNPIAFAAPVAGGHPVSVDIATSAIAWNRMALLEQMGRPMPADAIVDAAGKDTAEATEAAALLPLGGRGFGHKGAALASMVDILSSALTGMAHGFRLAPMHSDDLSTPRGLGHFFLVIDPGRFTSAESYEGRMRDYLGDLRAQPARDQATAVLAPGDVEARAESLRRRTGIPVDGVTWSSLGELAAAYGIAAPSL